MVIFESCLSSRAFKRGLEMPLLTELSRISIVMLSVLAMMKFVDLADRAALPLLFVPRPETYMYWLEITAGIIAPIVLFSQRKIRNNPNGLFAGSLLIILGFILNRMNITITGMQGWTGTSYFPHWMEISVTVSIVTAGFIGFAYAAKYLPLFEHGSPAHHVPAKKPVYSFTEELETISQQN